MSAIEQAYAALLAKRGAPPGEHAFRRVYAGIALDHPRLVRPDGGLAYYVSRERPTDVPAGARWELACSMNLDGGPMLRDDIAIHDLPYPHAEADVEAIDAHWDAFAGVWTHAAACHEMLAAWGTEPLRRIVWTSPRLSIDGMVGVVHGNVLDNVTTVVHELANDYQHYDAAAEHAMWQTLAARGEVWPEKTDDTYSPGIWIASDWVRKKIADTPSPLLHVAAIEQAGLRIEGMMGREAVLRLWRQAPSGADGTRHREWVRYTRAAMSERRPANLRNVLSFAAVTVTLLAATAAISLVLATSVLQSLTSDIAASVESVRTIEEAEVTLLLHVRARDHGEQTEAAEQVRQLLAEAERYTTALDEQRALYDAKVAVNKYFMAAEDLQADHDDLKQYETAAIDALERLGDLDVAHTRAAQARAIEWDRLANVAAIVLGCAIVAITAVLVLWLRRRVIRPLFALQRTMKQFGDGDRTVRAEEQGPIELREMTRSFNDMAESIAAQRQAQIAFIGGVAHDLRNPLGALKLATTFLGPDDALPPEPQLRKTLGVITRQIDQLERMVGDFLDMAKIQAGTLALTIAQHDIRTIVGDSIELFEPTARARFHVTMPDDAVIVECDAVRIGQAVTNLISNAIKYSPPEEPIDVVVGSDRGEALIEVRDRGVGIPRDDQKRIFEPFRRGATRHVVPGTGLGLFNVQRIVEAHGGHIEVDSVPAVGSTFRLRMATCRSCSDQPSTPAATAAGS